MLGKEDLGLSLSLSTAEDHHRRFPPVQLNLMPSSMAPSPPFLMHHHHQKAQAQWSDLLASSCSERRSPSEMYRGQLTRPFLKGIDVNRTPAGEREVVVDDEEEAGVSSPNSTVSSVVSGGGKRNERELQHQHHPNSTGDESEMERACSRGISDEEDGDGSRKKLRLSKDQSAVLEESFKEHNTLNPKQKLALAKQLNLRPRQVEVWFQNRRARTKLKQTEVDCEFLKRCCENLTEENRRLQKEVQELRALKLSPQFYMQMTPPTTLTMCPSCERVAVPSSSSAAAATGTSTTTASPPTSSIPAPPPSADNNHANRNHNHQHPQQYLHHHHLPRLLLPTHHNRPIPIAPAGVAAAAVGGGHPLPWAPTPLRASAFIDAPPSRS